MVSLLHANFLSNHGTEQARDKASRARTFRGFHKATRALLGSVRLYEDVTQRGCRKISSGSIYEAEELTNLFQK